MKETDQSAKKERLIRTDERKERAEEAEEKQRWSLQVTQESERGAREVVTDWEREREREIVLAASCMFELIINESQSRK